MFFKMAAIPTNFHHISAYSGHTVVILIAIPRVLRSKNPVEQSFTHKNALKRTWRPFCFSKWALIQPILDIGLSQPRMFYVLGAIPRFSGRRIDWNNYLSEINKLYYERWHPCFSKWLPFQQIFIISRPIVDIQLWFWWLYPGFRGRGIHL